jgi:hypothetical protein
MGFGLGLEEVGTAVPVGCCGGVDDEVAGGLAVGAEVADGSTQPGGAGPAGDPAVGAEVADGSALPAEADPAGELDGASDGAAEAEGAVVLAVLVFGGCGLRSFSWAGACLPVPAGAAVAEAVGALVGVVVAAAAPSLVDAPEGAAGVAGR